LFRKPAPTIAPVETCVVDTGSAAHDAAHTSAAVATLAVNDSASGSGVSFFDIVSSTRRPAASPPAAIATVTTAKAIAVPFATFVVASMPTHRAAIFGASFHPRAKPASPLLAQWIALAAADVVTIATGDSAAHRSTVSATTATEECVTARLTAAPPGAGECAGCCSTTHTHRPAAPVAHRDPAVEEPAIRAVGVAGAVHELQLAGPSRHVRADHPLHPPRVVRVDQ
jgi:hypothetical protein